MMGAAQVLWHYLRAAWGEYFKGECRGHSQYPFQFAAVGAGDEMGWPDDGRRHIDVSAERYTARALAQL